MKKVRITAMRVARYDNLIEKYENKIEHACDVQQGQVFIADGWKKPEGLCDSAWETLSPFVLTLSCGGEDIYEGWMKNRKSAMISCNDGFRPVSFYLEAIDSDSYVFYGHEEADVPALTDEYPGIHTPRDLYDLLCEVWCAGTCPPRMRSDWTPENRTLGQCSITAFLTQDIFGGKVYGILRPAGNYHCYNEVDGKIFDLTSEQFEGEELSYENNPEQFRQVHFAKEEKRLRYELLKKNLRELCLRRYT